MKITLTLPQTPGEHFQFSLALVRAVADGWRELKPSIKDLVEWAGIRLANESYGEFEVEANLSLPVAEGAPHFGVVAKFNLRMDSQSLDHAKKKFVDEVNRVLTIHANRLTDSHRWLMQKM